MFSRKCVLVVCMVTLYRTPMRCKARASLAATKPEPTRSCTPCGCLFVIFCQRCVLVVWMVTLCRTLMRCKAGALTVGPLRAALQLQNPEPTRSCISCGCHFVMFSRKCVLVVCMVTLYRTLMRCKAGAPTVGPLRAALQLQKCLVNSGLTN